MALTSDETVIPEISVLAEVLREPVVRWIDRMSEADSEALAAVLGDAAARSTLIRLVASSEFAAAAILRDRDWFIASMAAGTFGVRLGAATLLSAIEQDADAASVKAQLRQCRNRGLVHILWRVINGADSVWDTLQSLSELADGLISAAMSCAERALAPRFGAARSADGESIPLITLAMGKLGGAELNFSSDIDLVFLYSEEGETDGPRSLSAHEYFTRVARQIVALLDEVTSDGFVYRVDTRLRPFGDSGPPVVSFAALENYLLQHGRSWERYAYIKARVISPMAAASVVRELQASIIDPFVYRRYLDYGVFESLRDMKSLIETEVRKRELAANIKLGPGGIREIEFIAQSLQLVRGGADSNLRRRELKQALSHLGHARGLGRNSVATLIAAYEFLRRFENALQAIRDQQTHDIPADAADRARLALVMGYDDWDTLAADLATHRENVITQFAEVAFRNDDDVTVDRLASEIGSLWGRSSGATDWAGFLHEEGYAEAEALAECVSGFANAPIQRQVDVSAKRRLDRFIRSFLPMLQGRPHPLVVCERVFAVLSKIVRRSAYVALLNENPAVLEQLVDLCEQSDYLAAEIERYPVLLDELLDPRLFTEQISVASMRDELNQRLEQLDSEDSEAVIESLAHFQRALLFRIAVADVSGNLPIMKVSDRLTELAEIVLNKALDVAWRDLVARHGEPCFESDKGSRKAGFGVIAYGKLGGMELSYRSDLDLVFLHDSSGSHQQTNGEKPLDNSMFFGRLVRRLVHFLTAQTSSGVLYEVDTRLRPSGQSGLLVVSIEGFAKYQVDNAWTWEHQALLRSRPVAGSPIIAREFERVRTATLRERVRLEQLLDDVLSMRKKMRKQLDKSTGEAFDLKQGEGGIGDIEFLVQYLVLKNARVEPALIHFSDNIRQLGVLEAVGLLDAEDVARLQEAYKAYRLHTHRLALDGKQPLVDPDEFVAERKLVKRIWQREMI